LQKTFSIFSVQIFVCSKMTFRFFEPVVAAEPRSTLVGGGEAAIYRSGVAPRARASLAGGGEAAKLSDDVAAAKPSFILLACAEGAIER